MYNKISQTLSSTTLFNFTDSIKYLMDNLENGFYVSYTYEKLPHANIGYIIPMACFCDIPLGQIKIHLTWYGNFGIGINKKYARKEYEICPVWYVHSHNREIRNLVRQKNHNELAENKLLPYFKQYYGFQEKETGIYKKKHFYDEREWRYIPLNYKPELIINKSKEELSVLIKNKNKTPLNRMELDLNEIEYIIIEHEENLKILLPFLEKLAKKKKVSYEDLIRKILLSRQIKNDF
jgi:hypothetical protein